MKKLFSYLWVAMMVMPLFPRDVYAVQPSSPAPVPLVLPSMQKGGQQQPVIKVEEPVVAPAKKEDIWKGSLLFLPQQLEALKNAALEAKTGASTDKTVIVAEEAPKPAAPLVTPVLYLNSVVYTKPGNWTLWLNGARISAHTADKTTAIDGLTVQKVFQHGVQFLWVNDAIRQNAAQWQDKCAAIPDGGCVVESAEEVTISKDKRSVRFMLHPNQKFSLVTMDVSEGVTAPAAAPTDNTTAIVPKQ